MGGNNTGDVAIGEAVNFERHSGVTVVGKEINGRYTLQDRAGTIRSGIARSSFAPKKLFRASSFVGTQAYISPQMAKNSGVSLKEDIWGFGIVLYEWSTGRHPFQKRLSSPGEYFGSLWDTMAEKEGLYLPIPGEGEVEQSTFSESLRDLVAKCLRKRPSERPSAAQLMQHPFIEDADLGACK